MSGADPPPGRWSRPGAWLLAALVAGALLIGSGCALASQQAGGIDHRVVNDPNNPSAVPFERGTMTRAFQPSEVGGVETVVARDPTSPSQLGQVRAYLQAEAASFQQGRYEDPARAHGMEMPGSRELEAGYGRIEVSYADVPNGGQVTYTATDQALVQALHAWFDRRQMGG